MQSVGKDPDGADFSWGLNDKFSSFYDYRIISLAQGAFICCNMDYRHLGHGYTYAKDPMSNSMNFKNRPLEFGPAPLA